MRYPIHFTWLFVAAMVFAHCETDDAAVVPNTGSAVVVVDGQALSTADIETIIITVTGHGISPDIVAPLTESEPGQWSGVIDGIPVGFNRHFTAEAFDAEGTLIYYGYALGIDIMAGDTVGVTIALNEHAPRHFENAVPMITSFVMSSTTATVGETLTLSVDAFDPDEDDTLIFTWEATGGTFSDDAAAITEWTAPAIPGEYSVTIFVADPHEAVSDLTVAIPVSAGGNTGAAHIDIVINTAPEVTGLVPEPTRIDEGEWTQLDLDVTDPDDDELAFEWRAGCDGTFDDAAAEDPTFTLNSMTEETCLLTVVISDGNGGENSASITIQTGPGVAVAPPGCEGALLFPDVALERAVREAIQMPSGEIHFADVAAVTAMNLEGANISDLTGIHCLGNLEALILAGNRFTSLAPLSAHAGLPNLRTLDIAMNSYLDNLKGLEGLGKLEFLDLYATDTTDLTPLAGLTSLREILLVGNEVTDISPVAGLVNLEILRMDFNRVADISPLAGLTQLRVFTLWGSDVSDITALSGLINLEGLGLHSSQVSDISPLVANEGIGNGDAVDLEDNPLDCTDPETVAALQTLLDRGVTLASDCTL